MTDWTMAEPADVVILCWMAGIALLVFTDLGRVLWRQLLAERKARAEDWTREGGIQRW